MFSIFGPLGIITRVSCNLTFGQQKKPFWRFSARSPVCKAKKRMCKTCAKPCYVRKPLDRSSARIFGCWTGTKQTAFLALLGGKGRRLEDNRQCILGTFWGELCLCQFCKNMGAKWPFLANMWALNRFSAVCTSDKILPKEPLLV